MSTLDRRARTLGTHSPLFYDEPLEFASAHGVWLTDVAGRRYLDAYNNVPHVGHTHPRVVEAIRDQASRLNIHTRYLNDRVVEYAERLLVTFDPVLDRVAFTNSGSEANDLALRIASQHAAAAGILISDFSYHGHTRALAEISTGLRAREALGAHVRAIRIPDLDGLDAGRDPADVRRDALAEVDVAIESLATAGFGLAAWLFDPLFSTEGLNRLPEGYVAAVAERVHRAGGLVIADEVQSGFGRTGDEFWGHRLHGLTPDIVTMGKPMGNGHPIGGAVLRADLLDEFGERNKYFNTFAGNPVSAAAGLAVLDVMRDEGLMENARRVGETIRRELTSITAGCDGAGPVRGHGLFSGLAVGGRESSTSHVPAAKDVVEGLKARGVLISRVGRDGEMLKVRPPMPFGDEHVPLLLDALHAALAP